MKDHLPTINGAQAKAIARHMKIGFVMLDRVPSDFSDRTVVMRHKKTFAIIFIPKHGVTYTSAIWTLLEKFNNQTKQSKQ